MRDSAKISVIVPAYNIENYIGDCILSIINQDYDNIEIIVINDGSTDSTLKVCAEIQEEYKNRNIIILSQDNMGVSVARNVGLDYASGDFIMFVDGDDSIVRNYASTLFHVLKKNNSDIVVCSCQKTFSQEDRKRMADSLVRFSGYTRNLKRDEAINEFLLNKHTGSSCEKIYSRNVINNTRFLADIRNNEDKFFYFQSLLRSDRISVIKEPLYICLEREGSATRTSTQYNTDSVIVSQKILEIIENEYTAPEIIHSAKFYYYSSVIYSIRMLSRVEISKADKQGYFNRLKELVICNDCFKVLSQHSLKYFVELISISLGYTVHDIFVKLVDRLLY